MSSSPSHLTTPPTDGDCKKVTDIKERRLVLAEATNNQHRDEALVSLDKSERDYGGWNAVGPENGVTLSDEGSDLKSPPNENKGHGVASSYSSTTGTGTHRCAASWYKSDAENRMENRSFHDKEESKEACHPNFQNMLDDSVEAHNEKDDKSAASINKSIKYPESQNAPTDLAVNTNVAEPIVSPLKSSSSQTSNSSHLSNNSTCSQKSNDTRFSILSTLRSMVAPSKEQKELVAEEEQKELVAEEEQKERVTEEEFYDPQEPDVVGFDVESLSKDSKADSVIAPSLSSSRTGDDSTPSGLAGAGVEHSVNGENPGYGEWTEGDPVPKFAEMTEACFREWCKNCDQKKELRDHRHQMTGLQLQIISKTVENDLSNTTGRQSEDGVKSSETKELEETIKEDGAAGTGGGFGSDDDDDKSDETKELEETVKDNDIGGDGDGLAGKEAVRDFMALVETLHFAMLKKAEEVKELHDKKNAKLSHAKASAQKKDAETQKGLKKAKVKVEQLETELKELEKQLKGKKKEINHAKTEIEMAESKWEESKKQETSRITSIENDVKVAREHDDDLVRLARGGIDALNKVLTQIANPN